MPSKEIKLAVMGLGYVGLPLAVAFGKTKLAPVIGFDISKKRIEELKRGRDKTGEVLAKDLKRAKIFFTTNPGDLKKANFIIVSVPTPITKAKKPNLSYIKSAAKTIGKNLQKGTIVVFESTVYPGVTEKVCGPIIEKHSRLKRGRDFKLGYSPERINPGDKKHTIDKIVKIISGEDKAALKKIEKVYGLICKAGLHKAPNIKTAEAAKVIENIQRDLNIALINEVSIIVSKLGLDAREIMKGAATKWNIQYFEPGLVGGHCLTKDPYYLTYLAKKMGVKAPIILAGRRINEYMPHHLAKITIQAIKEADRKRKGKILVLGLTFKENCRDYRNSIIKETISDLKKKGYEVLGYDPLLSAEEIKEGFNIKAIKNPFGGKEKFSALILDVIHKQFKKLKLSDFEKILEKPPVLIDVKGFFRKKAKEEFIYRSL